VLDGSFGPCERAAINLVCQASTLGTVKIVTQATLGWYRMTCSTYMPDLYHMITSELNIEVISARENHENTPNLHFDNHKTVEFHNLVNAMLWNADKHPTTGKTLPVSVMSIGDGQREYVAAQKLLELIPIENIKIVKMIELPEAEQLTEQLIGIATVLEEVIDNTQHFCTDFGQAHR